ncbi:MAG TPA: hypothetical protein VD907_05880 [Verrucomicrobiae bacterium]|nr:hypothetical protein [Verrucomicrobiae bacterium]
MQVDNNGKVTIAGKSVQFWIVAGILVVFVLTILSLIVQYALVRITLQPETGITASKLTTKALETSGEEKAITTLFGYSLVPRGAAQLVTTGEDTETVTPIKSLPLFGATDIVVKPKKQRSVEKIGAEGSGCEIVNNYGVFSYNCTNLQRVLKFNRPNNGPWRVSIVDDSPVQQFNFVRYRDGNLTFSDESGNFSLEYREPGAPLATVAHLPINAPDDAERDLLLITNKTSKDHPGFAILNRQRGELFYYGDLKNGTNTVQLQRKIKINPSFDVSLCSMNTSQIACYFGPTSHPPDSHEATEHKEKAILPTLEVFDTAGQHKNPSYSLPIDGLAGVDNLFMIKDGTLFAVSDEKLYRLERDGDRVKATLVSPDITSVDNGESLVYVRGDKLYRYDTGTHETRLVFASKNLRLGNVQAMGPQVLFNTYVRNGSGDTTHTYMIEETARPATRLEDKLPYADRSLPIRLMDYSDSHIYVRLAVSVISDHRTGRMIAEPSEVQRAEYVVTQRLRNDGLLKHNPRLIFDY